METVATSQIDKCVYSNSVTYIKGSSFFVANSLYDCGLLPISSSGTSFSAPCSLPQSSLLPSGAEQGLLPNILSQKSHFYSRFSLPPPSLMATGATEPLFLDREKYSRPA